MRDGQKEAPFVRGRAWDGNVAIVLQASRRWGARETREMREMRDERAHIERDERDERGKERLAVGMQTKVRMVCHAGVAEQSAEECIIGRKEERRGGREKKSRERKKTETEEKKQTHVCAWKKPWGCPPPHRRSRLWLRCTPLPRAARASWSQTLAKESAPKREKKGRGVPF